MQDELTINSNNLLASDCSIDGWKREVAIAGSDSPFSFNPFLMHRTGFGGGYGSPTVDFEPKEECSPTEAISESIVEPMGWLSRQGSFALATSINLRDAHTDGVESDLLTGALEDSPASGDIGKTDPLTQFTKTDEFGQVAAVADNAGNTPATARIITVGGTTTTYSDWVGSTDTNDYYRFSLANPSNFNLLLDGLSADADVAILNSSGTIIGRSENDGTAPERLTGTLNAGTYYIRVYPYGSNNSYYNLGVGLTNLDKAGNTPSTARNITVGSTTTTYSDWVGSTDSNDYYRFSLNSLSNFNLTLNGLSADADVQVLNSSGTIVGRSENDGTAAESLAGTLNAGTYYIRVYPYGSANTNYNLSLSAVTGDPGNTLGTAEVQSSAIFSRSQQVSASDLHDFYRFSVGQSGIFTANLTGLTGDADIRLIRDSNNNGAINQGEVQAWQWERGTRGESIRDFLNPGTYFLQVNSYNNQTANYSVATNFTPAASDNRRFSTQINFGQGLNGLSQAARNAITEAVRFWEPVISHSTFNGSHTLTVDVIGGYEQAGWLAAANYRQLARDANGRMMPVTGGITINTYYLNNYNNNPNYLGSVLRHEFGHVLGIGTLWGSPIQPDPYGHINPYGRSLLNYYTGTYNANTYAGWAYGELRRTFMPMAIEVTKNTGSPGSDWGHWREEVFNTELMTHQSEGPGVTEPLSQMTIASLRDLGWNVNYGVAQPYSLPA